MKTTLTLPSPDYVPEFTGDLAKLRVGDELRVLQPSNPRWALKGMHCIVRKKNDDCTIECERIK